MNKGAAIGYSKWKMECRCRFLLAFTTPTSTPFPSGTADNQSDSLCRKVKQGELYYYLIHRLEKDLLLALQEGHLLEQSHHSYNL